MSPRSPECEKRRFGTRNEGHTGRSPPAAGRLVPQNKAEMGTRNSNRSLLRVTAVAGHVGYVERLIEAKIQFRFGRDAQRFDL